MDDTQNKKVKAETSTAAPESTSRKEVATPADTDVPSPPQIGGGGEKEEENDDEVI